MNILRGVAWSTLVGAMIGLGLACSPDRTPRIPNDTPDCATTCDAAWPCGGVLENDLDFCHAACDEEEHGQYRLCIAETVCEEMYTCKVYGPAGAIGPADTDP